LTIETENTQRKQVEKGEQVTFVGSECEDGEEPLIEVPSRHSECQEVSDDDSEAEGITPMPSASLECQGDDGIRCWNEEPAPKQTSQSKGGTKFDELQFVSNLVNPTTAVTLEGILAERVTAMSNMDCGASPLTHVQGAYSTVWDPKTDPEPEEIPNGINGDRDKGLSNRNLTRIFRILHRLSRLISGNSGDFCKIQCKGPKI
jgi:hypothetical protein